MDQNSEITHILDIKITQCSDNNIIKNKHLLKQVKRYLTCDKYTHVKYGGLNGKEEITLLWKKKKWLFPYNKFVGDLVANSQYKSDITILNHTTQTIEDILKTLRQDYSYWEDFDIIFSISKPLQY